MGFIEKIVGIVQKVATIWFLFQQLDETRLERLNAIDAERNKTYREFYEPHLNKAMKTEDSHRLDQEYQAIIAPLDNEYEYLMQVPLLDQAVTAGVIANPEFYKEEKPSLKYKVLSEAGAVALRRKIGQHRRETVKDWVSIVMPVISGAIAILGLLVALKKR